MESVEPRHLVGEAVLALNAVVFLAPDACSGGPEFDSPPVIASNCLGGGTVFANVYGDADFLRSVLDGLGVESFSPAPT